MEEEFTREEEKMEPPADGSIPEEAEDGSHAVHESPPDEVNVLVEEAISKDPDYPTVRVETESKALQRSIGLGLPSDRYRVVLPKGSFPPLTGRQQFIARLRDKDRVTFRVFEGDEELASQNDFLVEIGMVGLALNNEDKAFLEVDFHLNIDKILTLRLLDKFGEKEALVILDMARRPKVTVHQDKLKELTDKLDSLTQHVGEIGERLTRMGGVASERGGS